MTKKIDVNEIAVKIRDDFTERWANDIAALIQSAESNVVTSQDAIAQTVASFKHHTERFVIELIQKVVDELQKQED